MYLIGRGRDVQSTHLCTAHVDSVNVLHDSDHEFCVLLLYSTMSTEVKCISLDIGKKQKAEDQKSNNEKQ